MMGSARATTVINNVKFEDLSEEDLISLYYSYLEYRDSLSYLSTPIPIRQFYELKPQ